MQKIKSIAAENIKGFFQTLEAKPEFHRRVKTTVTSSNGEERLKQEIAVSVRAALGRVKGDRLFRFLPLGTLPPI